MITGLLLVALVAGAAGDRFDLACSGTKKIWAFHQEPVEQPWTGTLRVDLAASRFCYEDCKLSKPIKSVTDETITLEGFEPYSPMNSELNRRTGVLRMGADVGSGTGRHGSDVVATCEPRKFTGLPTTKF